MELVKKFKRMINFKKNVVNAPLESNNEIITLENTFDTIYHYPKESIIITLLQLQKIIQILDPDNSHNFLDREFKNVNHLKIFSDVIYAVEEIHANQITITTKEVH